MVEFICEVCGILVRWFTGEEPTADRKLCAVCEFLEGIEDERERDKAREFLAQQGAYGAGSEGNGSGPKT